ncbi:MAG: hypothetical protein NTW12_12205 [Deltaproteobacteria bacterium]|nr:hypothetical protein [Deltaproteobacteria bacterium]
MWSKKLWSNKGSTEEGYKKGNDKEGNENQEIGIEGCPSIFFSDFQMENPEKCYGEHLYKQRKEE